MEKDTYILLALGWRASLSPSYFLGMDISWLVMEETFISPYDQKKYNFNEAIRIEAYYHPLQVQLEWAA